jgi:hypothetical protein
MDGVATKPVVGVNDMAKFLTIINEGSNLHKIALPVQMAMQHYQKPQKEKQPIVEKVQPVVRSSSLRQYYNLVESEQQDLEEKPVISERARQIADRVIIKEKSVSEKQARTMAAAAHDPKFAKKLGIKQSVAKEFNQKDKGTALLSNAMKKKKNVKENEIPGHSMGFTGGVGPGMGDYTVDEMSVELDKNNPLKSRINHKSNPGSIEYRIMRARRQLKDLAQMSESNDLLTWETIARHFPELAMNIEEVRHGIEELAKIKKGGGRRSANIPSGLGETNSIKEANAKKRSLKNSNPCWKGYHPVGTKKKGGHTVPNCVPSKE